MLVTPLPGVDRRQLVQVLEEVGRGAENLRGTFAGKHPIDAVSTYLTWAGDAARRLRTLIAPADIDRLVLTRRYGQLLTASSAGSAVLFKLLDVEVEERVDAFSAATAALHTVIEHWSPSPGVFVVADTSVFIQHPKKLDDIDFAALVGVRGEEIHLLLPIVVIDELDGLKRSTNKHARWRAGHTLAVLDRVFAHTTGRSRLRAEDFSALNTGGIPRGAITAEMVLDPPGHVRLPINDDELVDRVLRMQPLADRPIRLVTFDTGQSTRARAAGLHAIKHPDEPCEDCGR